MNPGDRSIDTLVNYDPIGKFIQYRLGLSPFMFGLIVLLLDIIVDGVMGYHWGLLVSESSTPGLLQDYMALTTDFLFNPIICGLYLWFPQGATRMFQRLHQSEGLHLPQWRQSLRPRSGDSKALSLSLQTSAGFLDVGCSHASLREFPDY